MNTQARPGRHEVGFSFTDASKARADQLLDKCGHNDLRLLMARGLALVEWVEDQLAQGRIVASVRQVSGEEGGSATVKLVERPELLAPKSRALHVVSNSPAAPIPLPADEPEPVDTLHDSAPVELDLEAKRKALAAVIAENPKLKARPKVAAKPEESRRNRSTVNRRAELALAHKVNDVSGPIKSFVWVRAHCEVRGKKAPIMYRDKALPGTLANAHMEHLEAAINVDSRVSHFQINDYGDLSFYGYISGRGWCSLEIGTLAYYPDPNLAAGIGFVFPVALALDYLRDAPKDASCAPDTPSYDTRVPRI